MIKIKLQMIPFISSKKRHVDGWVFCKIYAPSSKNMNVHAYRESNGLLTEETSKVKSQRTDSCILHDINIFMHHFLKMLVCQFNKRSYALMEQWA